MNVLWKHGRHMVMLLSDLRVVFSCMRRGFIWMCSFSCSIAML